MKDTLISRSFTIFCLNQPSGYETVIVYANC